jgi:hypothetical protein
MDHTHSRLPPLAHRDCFHWTGASQNSRRLCARLGAAKVPAFAHQGIRPRRIRGIVYFAWRGSPTNCRPLGVSVVRRSLDFRGFMCNRGRVRFLRLAHCAAVFPARALNSRRHVWRPLFVEVCLLLKFHSEPENAIFRKRAADDLQPDRQAIHQAAGYRHRR